MSLQRVPVNNFRGGLNVRDSPFELQPNESPDLLNVTISNLVGQLESRKGKTRVDVSGMPVAETDFAKQVIIGANKRFLMLSINGGVYAMKPNGEVIKLFAGSAKTVWDFEVFSDSAFKDWVYMGNGVDVMQKWDGEAAATVEWAASKGTIPKGGVLCVWENRMFISYVSANVQRIYFSEFGDPQAGIKEYGFVDVRGPEEDLDAIQDLVVLGSRLIVLKRRAVFFISSAVTMTNRRIGGPGVWARFQTVELEDKLYFFNPQGLFSTGGSTITMESGSITNYFPEKVTQSALEKARLIATKDTYPRLLISLPTEKATTNNALIEMVPHINFRRIGGRRYLLLPAFMLHSITASCLACWNPTGTEEMIVGPFERKLAATEFPVFTGENVLATGGFGGENPFAKAIKAVAWAANTGQITSYAGVGGKGAHTVWEPKGKAEELLALLDSFKRVEAPLSNGAKWTVINGFSGTGECTASGWVGTGGTTAGEDAAFWNVKEFTEPMVSATIGGTQAAANAKMYLYACLSNPTNVKKSGYRLSLTQGTLAEGRQVLAIERMVEGVFTTLVSITVKASEANAFELGDGIAIQVSNGEVLARHKKAAGKWETVLTAVDATFTKGFSAMGNKALLHEKVFTLTNFEVGEALVTTAITAFQETTKEITNPGASIELYQFSKMLTLNVCFAAAARTGYTFRWTYVEAEKAYTLTVEKWTAGAKVVLLTVVAAMKGKETSEQRQKIGCWVIGGKLRAFIKEEGTSEWKNVGEVADATLTKGFCGSEAEGEFELRAFEAAETFTELARVSRLFNGTSDEGAEIQSHWHSAWMAIQGEEPKERLRRLNVELDGDVYVDVFTDFSENPIFTAKLPFLEPKEETGKKYRFARVRPETRGRFHSIRFRNVPGSEPFLINTAELVIRGGKEH